MSPPRATLGGIPLTNAGPVAWNQTTGATPPMQTFVIHDSQWDAMEALFGTAVDLVITSETAPELRWTGLYPLREVVTRLPMHRAVVVSDIRWKWAREVYIKSFNVPRKTGERTIKNGSPIEIAVDYDLFGYAYASLKPDGDTRRKWTAFDCIRDVLENVTGKVGGGFSILGMSLLNLPEISIEALEVAENADHAIDRMIRLVPQAMITVDKNGDAIVFDGTDREVAELVMADAGPPTVAGQIDRIIELKKLRPKRVHVYFAKEVELRFDSKEENEDPDRTVTQQQLDDEELTGMENVLPLPDPVTTIDGVDFYQGTWIPVKKAVEAWAEDMSALARGDHTPPALTMERIRALWWRLEAAYTLFGDLQQSGDAANWAARIMAIRQHYRQTYQIPMAWMQRIRDIRPFRIGVLDPVSGARAPAQAWGQFTIEPDNKMYAIADLQNNDDLKFAWIGVDNYPGIEGELYTKVPSPAVVSLVDKDLGILHINYRTDPFGMRQQIHPSLMKQDQSGKKQSITRDLRSFRDHVSAKDGVMTGAARLGLNEDFRVAVILTAMPFDPNDEGRFFKYTVEGSDVASGIAGHFQTTGGEGPDWHIVVPQSLCTAWYAALSTTSEGRESAKILFGITDADDRNEVPGYEIVNMGTEGSPALIPAMARAVAVAQWGHFVSQREGTRGVHLQPGVDLSGSIESVRHSLAPDGRLITEVSMPQARRPLDPMALLPNATRPYILGTIPDFHS